MASSMFNVMATNEIRIVSEWSHLHCIVCDHLMVNAYIADCGCQFCKSCVDAYLKDGARRCPGVNHHEPYMLSDGLVLPDKGANVRIARLNVLCPNNSCNCTMELEKMDEHLRVCDSRLLECPFSRMGCEGGGEGKINLNLHLNSENAKHSRFIIDTIESMQNEIMIMRNGRMEDTIELAAQREELIKLREEVRMKQVAMETLKLQREEDKEKFMGEISDIKKTLEERKEGDRSVSKELFTWEVKNFSDKVKEARCGGKKTWYSEIFCTHSGGYALRLHLMPNGYGNRGGTHLCVGFQIMRGVNDGTLTWPFDRAITIGLVHHSGSQERCVRRYEVASTPAERKYVFEKPVHAGNHGHGDNDVISIEELTGDRCFFVHDTLLVRCCLAS